ncbi:MAG: SufD family Fe-S cluster assembly protein, partial [Christensenellales bacterium]|nr:SufD family Fe-S cluster assembly protein [Christensenellales bacterium]
EGQHRLSGKEHPSMEKMTINQLPSRTWNRLGVNEATIDWDESATVVLPEESAEKADMLIASDAAYARKRVTVQAEKGTNKSLFQTLRTAGKLHVQTELTAEDGAEIELIQLVAPGENALVYDEVIGHCHGSGRIVLRQVTLGHGDVYAQTGIGLDGENASFAANIGYLARKNQTLDMNLVVNHWGKKTKCEINASGALNDAAKKIFRGTIDFKCGSSGSVGSEQETVLMLGEDAVNKTVPVILCAEENVEGTHGATIGEMDDDTRFYFASRGIDRETAEKLLSRAAIARVAQQVKSETARAAILNELDGEMDENDGLQA